jgi:predicted deacylase
MLFALTLLSRGKGAYASEALQIPDPPADGIFKSEASSPRRASANDEIVIGYSMADRPLIAHRFGDGETSRLIVAGIHGGYEWNTSELATQLIQFLREHPEVVPAELTLFVLPALNPDGLARSRGYEGRANENGVDLNRNFPSNWQPNWRTTGCWDFLPISGGDYPLSEPESRALVQFALAEHVEALISYHSAALGIFAGGRPSSSGSLHLAETIAAVTGYAYPPRETGCEYTGNLTDWASDNGISAIDIELSTHYSIDLNANLRALLTFLNWQRPRH